MVKGGLIVPPPCSEPLSPYLPFALRPLPCNPTHPIGLGINLPLTPLGHANMGVAILTGRAFLF